MSICTDTVIMNQKVYSLSFPTTYVRLKVMQKIIARIQISPLNCWYFFITKDKFMKND